MILEALGMLGTIGGGMVSASATLEEANNVRDASRRQAELLRASAIDAVRRGQAAAGAARAAGSEAIAELRAAAGASGVSSASGTAANLQAYTREAAELAAQQHANNAARAAWGQRMQAWEELRVGRETVSAARTRALAQVMGMGASFGAQAYSAQKNGT